METGKLRRQRKGWRYGHPASDRFGDLFVAFPRALGRRGSARRAQADLNLDLVNYGRSLSYALAMGLPLKIYARYNRLHCNLIAIAYPHNN